MPPLLTLLLALLLIAPPASAQSEPKPKSAAALRQEAAQRKRRLIFNNDGNDAVHFPAQLAPTRENFLAQRTTPLLGTHVDSISYCTNRGIGLVLHQSKVNQVLDWETRAKAGVYADKINIVGRLRADGTDPLRLVADFCRQHGKEILWSMRMNDIHDGGNDAMLPAFKKEHPELLFGSKIAPPPYHGYSGVWGSEEGKTAGYSGVDYGRPEVRELVFKTLDEVCRGYDVDGVELDFFRSPVLFKSHAWQKPVSAEERDALTELIQRVRRLVDEVGVARSRPMLLGIRVPDSVPYCVSMGIDLERWLREGLLDLLIPGGDFVLSPWETSVELGKRHAVAVYPCITRAPTTANPGYEGRSTLETYRARALRAWNAGADGLHIFNIFDPRHPVLRELGDPAALNRANTTWYASELPTRNAQTYHANWRDFRVLPTLSPEHPAQIAPGANLTTTLHVAQTIAAVPAAPTASLVLRCEDPQAAAQLLVTLNGASLAKPQPERANWLNFEVPAGIVKNGANEIQIQTQGRPATILDLRIAISYPPTPE